MSRFLMFCAVLLCFHSVFGIPRIAVMEIIDETGKLDSKILKSEEREMRTVLVKKGKKKFTVVSTAEQEKIVVQMRNDSYRMDRDRNGQIALGKMMSAQEIIYTVVSPFGTDFTVTSTLIDIKTGRNVDATSEVFSGGEKLQQKLRAVLTKNIDYLISQMEDFENREESENKQNQEEIYCEKARKSNNPAGWRSYLETYPKGICAAEARENLDKQACAHAKKRNSIEIWQGYLRMFPEGTCKYEADTAISKLRQQEERRKKNKDKESEGRKKLDEWERSNR